MPILVSIYPVAIVLINGAVAETFHFSGLSYKLTVYVVFFISILQGLKVAGIEIPFLHGPVSRLPLAADGMEWALPALIILVVCTAADRLTGSGKQRTAA